ncbi:hypothetical protein VTK73DRAFT_7631 [Phialemonium thermophilum]|uniref:CoA-binding domain-containing protein n=1 Tax=Phialemonium thermophilum TaxID=223376 RepID=A0ABR3Y7T5_9PEZI
MLNLCLRVRHGHRLAHICSSVHTSCRYYTRTARLQSYASTLPNVRIHEHTRVIFQGFTGRQATANAKDSLQWGTRIVGGVTPGRTGEHLGLPVLPTVRKAMEQLRPDATGVYVAASQAAAAIEEAIDAEIPLIVAVAEHIPLHDMLRIHQILKTQDASRLIGPNSPGIISAVGRCRIGFQPLPCFTPGRIGIAAKSGTLSYETVASTTRAGLGQSLCIGVGGDILPGTDLLEALQVLVKDEDTEAIALIGEIGGSGELDAAAWIDEYIRKTSNPKPIVALIAGVSEAKGHIMGHAGAFTIPGEPDARTKIRALRDVGVSVVNHPSKFGDELKRRLADQGLGKPLPARLQVGDVSQRRQCHTRVTRPRFVCPKSVIARSRCRSLYLPSGKSSELLRQRGVDVCPYDKSGRGKLRLLAVGIDRSSRAPCIIACPSQQEEMNDSDSIYTVSTFATSFQRFPLPRGAVGWTVTSCEGTLANSERADTVNRVATHLRLRRQSSVNSLERVLNALIALFYEKEAFYLETSILKRLGGLEVVSARFGLDDAAFRSAGRQTDIHGALAQTEPARRDGRSLSESGAKWETDPEAEAEAAQNGIVYIRLPGADATIGTLVNGAGLAMNTVDALADAGGRAANFLDTGGKATSDTVRIALGIVLRDPRVRVVFVNIFGGLTLGDMIARGVILAFQNLRPTVPFVVRIRGTNEEEARDVISKSGLPLFAFDDFENAAAKAIELSKA